MDPLSIVASTISILEAASATYKVLLRIKGLPKEFAEVERTLPLAEDVLSKVHGAIARLDEQSKKAIQPTATDCLERATKLRDILDRLNNDPGTKENGTLDVYRKALRRLGKSHRVESLMSGLLKGLDKLAQHQLFGNATQCQVEELQTAIAKLGNIESSIPDSDIEGSSVHMEQNIAQGGSGTQISGERHSINTGPAPMYNLQNGNMYFGYKDPLQVAKEALEKKRASILQLLTAAADHADRRKRNPQAVEGTCLWFMNHPYFTKWRESETSEMLFVSANPGCGKSVLANHLINKKLGAAAKSRTFCHYFFKDDFEDQKNAKIALQCILLQLFSERPELLSGRVIELFDMAGVAAVLSLQQLWNIFITALQIQTTGEVVCLIDAYDECSGENGQKAQLSALLRDFYVFDNEIRTQVRLKFLITSRFNMKTKQDLMLGIKGVPIIFLQGESDDNVLAEISAEVNLYIEHEVLQYRQIAHLSDDASSLLLDTLKAVDNRTYLWVYLIFKYIWELAPRSREEIRKATASLPETVDEAYERILKQSRDTLKARKLLHIIVAAEQPLTLAEMQVAMAIRETDKCYEDLADRLVSEKAFRESISSICSLFITIFKRKIYLIHQTAKEFLVSTEVIPCQKHKNGGSSTAWKASLRPIDSHRVLVEICLLHLLFSDIATHHQRTSIGSRSSDEGRLSSYRHPQIQTFLSYSSRYWVHHFHQSGLDEKQMLNILMDVCDASTARCQTWFAEFWTSIGTELPSGFTTTMIASYFGLSNLARVAFRRASHELKHVDGTYHRSALSWAAENGCDEIIKMLVTPLRMLTSRVPLLKRIDIDGKDVYGRTALSYAAWKGHTSIAKRLVSAGASVSIADDSGYSPLQYALYAENNETLKALAAFSPVESLDLSRQKLLLAAAERGNQAVVRWLLERNTYTELQGSSGLTPLWQAIRCQEYAVAEVLLNHGANTNAAIDGLHDNLFYYSVLRSGAAEGVPFFQRLLRCGADIDARDASGRTALYIAAVRSDYPILRYLLTEGAQVDTREKSGDNALSWCVAHGTRTRAESVLENRRDNALRWLAAHDAKACIELLLENGADIQAPHPKTGCTPLHASVLGNNAFALELLLAKGAKTEARDWEGATPLAVAAGSRLWTHVALLIRSGADIEAAGQNAYSLLHTAMADGDISILAALLCRGLDPSLAGPEGMSAIELMVREKTASTLWKLVRLKGWSAEVLSISEQVLLYAVEDGDAAAVENLIKVFTYYSECARAIITAKSANGESALWMAVMHGHDRIAHLLLNNGVPVDATEGSTARAALHLAAETGRLRVVRILLKHGAKVDILDINGHTPLWKAVEHRHSDVVNELLERGARPDVCDVRQQTLISMAEGLGCEPLVSLLKQKSPPHTNAESAQQPKRECM
ncbi:hypothetical protein PWT90_07276 [Aphanocladium album]|nr:hypothetical protein PWT90_07276 [Aphanocladium album]